MKKIYKIMLIILLSIIILISVSYLLMKKYKESVVSNKYTNLLKNDILLEYMGEKDRFRKSYYMSDENFKEVKMDVTVKYYIDLIMSCKYKDEKFENKTTIFSGNSLDSPTNYPMSNDCIKKIKEFVDCEENNVDKISFKKQLIEQLENKLIHKSNKEYEDWYIEDDKEKCIDLKYNVYINFVPDKKEKRSDFVSLEKIKIDNDNKKYIAYYINNNTEIIKFEHELYYDENNNIRIDSFQPIFLTNFEKSKITFGQHDYDAYQKQWLKENDSSYDELPHVNWDENDE